MSSFGISTRLLTLGLCLACCGTSFAQNPTRDAAESSVEDLLGKVRKDMRTIDKLLDRASKAAPAQRPSATRTGAGELDRTLEESLRASTQVVKTIDKILEQLAKKGGS